MMGFRYEAAEVNDDRQGSLVLHRQDERGVEKR
jgi:hypothetical protein